MSYAIGIVAHQDRAGMADELSAQVKADFVSVDDGTIGAGANHRRVWRELVDHHADFSVVLEDDAVPVLDFRSQLEDILLACETPIVSLYLGRNRPPQWQAKIQDAMAKADIEDASWITSGHLIHGVGVAIKTKLIRSMLGHWSELPIDQHISVWARNHQHLVAYTHPSIVDHADVPTLIRHHDGKDRLPGRIAWQWGSRTKWTDRSVEL